MNAQATPARLGQDFCMGAGKAGFSLAAGSEKVQRNSYWPFVTIS